MSLSPCTKDETWRCHNYGIGLCNVLGHNYLGILTVIMQKLLPVATLKVNLQKVFSHTSININAQYSMKYHLCIIVANKQFVVHYTIQWTTIINLDYWKILMCNISEYESYRDINDGDMYDMI